MASAKLILAPKVYADGTSPVLLRFIVNREKFTKQLVRVRPDHWDPKRMVLPQDRLSQAKNKLLISKLREAELYLIECKQKGAVPDPNAFFAGEVSDATLLGAIDKVLERYAREGIYHSKRRLEFVRKKVEDFGEDPPVSQLSTRWLMQYDSFLKALGNKPNTRRKEFKMLRTAIRPFILSGVIAKDPFKAFKIPVQKTTKQKLTRDEFDRLKAVNIDNPKVDLARDIFVFATLQRGLRIHDVLTLTESENLQDGRLVVHVKKTGKTISMKITDHAQWLIQKYRGQSYYIFPVLGQKNTGSPDFYTLIDRKNAALRKHLKKAVSLAGIDKHITMHCARHTFAYLADKHGISIPAIQKLLDHSNMMITEGYIRSLRRDDELDNAVEGMWE